MTLTRPKVVFLRNCVFKRVYSTEQKIPPTIKNEKNEEKPKKEEIGEPKITEAQSYEKWIQNVNSYKKGALSNWDQLKLSFSDYWKQSPNSEVWYTQKVNIFVKKYENFTGLTEVKAAQALVIKEENLFVEVQARRREAQIEYNEIQNTLKNIRSKLEQISRTDDRYIPLVTEEQAAIKQDEAMSNKLKHLDSLEREKFNKFSRAVRDSHEKERSQAEQTKYYSLFGSIAGTLLGFFGSVWINRQKMNELRQLVKEAANFSQAPIINNPTVSDPRVLPALEQQDSKLSSLFQVMQDFKLKLNDLDKNLRNQPAPIIEISSPEINLSKDIQELEHAMINLIEAKSKILNMRDEKFLESLKKANGDSYNSFSSRVCDIEEKVTDIRSLLLSQVVSSSNSVISSSVKNHEAVKAAERSNKTILSTVESALSEHEEKLRVEIITATLAVAIFVPVVTFLINKLF